MSVQKRIYTGLLSFLILSLTLIACKDDPSGPVTNTRGQYYSVNQWMNVNMEYYYFWNDLVPEEVDGTITPETNFENMLEAEDIFSYMSDDYEELQSDLQGSSFSAGFSPAFGRFSNTDNVFIIVEFVYPNTPAAEAGIERGDIILEINNQQLTTSNYLELYYAEGDAVYLLGEYDAENNAISAGETLTVAKEELSLDPVVYTNVYEKNGTKIGYMFYARFLNGENNQFIESMNQALSEFQSQGVTEMVVDLRYNPGGTISSSVNFASALAPSAAVSDNALFVRYQYNEDLEEEIRNSQSPNAPDLETRFSQTPVNLDLERVFFLTTNSSASASELIINGLEPYMDVVQIGTPTFGKYYGSFVLTGQSANPANNYAIVPVVLKYANASGITDFRDGLEPDYEVQEDIFQAVALGDTTDPLLNTALGLITGESEPAAKQMYKPLPYELMQDPVRMKKGNVFKVVEGIE